MNYIILLGGNDEKTLLSFFLLSCSNDQNSTSLSLTVRGGDFSRSAARDATGTNNEDDFYVTAAIIGAYEETQSAFMASNGECTFIFDFVPVGVKVRAVLKVYVLETGENGSSKHLLYSGESEEIVVENGENYLDILLGPPHTVTFNSNGGSELEQQTVEFGKRASRPADPTRDGKVFRGWYVDSDCLGLFDFNTVITEDTTLYAKWVTAYSVNISSTITHGTVTADKTTVIPGETVTLTISASSGYEFNTLSVNNDEGVIISTTAITSGRTYTFTMPESNVTVSATFTFQGTSYTVLPPGTDGTAGTEWTYVLFGDWPQTIKAPDVEVDEEDSITRGEFTYYRGNDGAWYARCEEKAHGSNYTYSDGTTVGSSYTNKYFKVEPIKWRVLTNNYSGKKLLLAENILTAHRYAISTNNYKNSEIRTWLNGTFLLSGFSTNAQSSISMTNIDNSMRSTNTDPDPNYFNSGYNGNSCSNTDDRIFILSLQEVTKADYGFSASSRIHFPSDYAKAKGVSYSTSDKGGWWWLRSPHWDYTAYSYAVKTSGFAGYDNSYYSCYKTDCVFEGVVPALCVE